jgi:hypothetical protein
MGALEAGGKTLLQWRVGKGSATVETCAWHPEFGLSQPTRRLAVTLAAGESAVEVSW